MSDNEKMMDFKEWNELSAWDLKIDTREEFMQYLFEKARQGTIPASSDLGEAVRIPPVSEWPEWASDMVCEFRSDFGRTQHVLRFHTQSRPVPQWVPKVGEAVFLFHGEHSSVGVGEIHTDFGPDFVIKNGAMQRPIVHLSDLKPFNPKYIGKPWDQIPSGVEE